MSASNHSSDPLEEDKNLKSGIIWGGLLILSILTLWLIYPFTLGWINAKWPMTHLAQTGTAFGTFGDTYGALNTLFSGLAFAILILSLFLQRKELQAQRLELRDQRLEIKKSNAIADQQRLITQQQKDLNEQQIHDAKVQNFYNLLFRFLDEKRRKIEALELNRTGPIRGDYIFERFITGVLGRLKAAYLTPELIEDAPLDELQLILDDLVADGHDFTKDTLIDNQYFEYIDFILRFIEDHENLGITDTAIKIFISHQSVNEMLSMFVVSLIDDQLQKYITKYILLRQLNTYYTDECLFALVEKTIGRKSYTP
ncbi:MAG: hypothetical protein ACK4GA_02510 [Acinetobacter sp.]|uniref:hypothetical protein n=1 Tax=Acinetobacter sp. TaxID=472 RepID=UPI00391897DF